MSPRSKRFLVTGLVLRRAQPGDEALCHEVASATFALACPPGTDQEDIDRFIVENLSVEAFQNYLASPRHEVVLCLEGEAAVGYSMVVRPPVPDDIVPMLQGPNALELSKIYVRATHHGGGVAKILLAEVVDVARAEGMSSVWLGVNQKNDRANRFYAREGFDQVGEKNFQVGSRLEDDFVREKRL